MHFVMAGTTAPSHVFPSLALIAELVVARAPRDLRGRRPAHASSSPRPAPRCIGHASVLPDADTAWPDDPGEAMRLFLDDAIARAAAAARASSGPTRSCTTSAARRAPSPRTAGALPAIQLSPTYVAWEGYEVDMAEFTAALKASASGQAYFATVRSWLDENGLDTTPTRSSAARGLRRADPARDPAPPRARRTALRVRRPVHRRRAHGRLDAAGGRRPPAGLCSFGTAYTDTSPPTAGSSTSCATTTGSCSRPARSTRPSSARA